MPGPVNPRAYEAEVAMGRLDGRRTVEDVFRETRRGAVFQPGDGAGYPLAAVPGAELSRRASSRRCARGS